MNERSSLTRLRVRYGETDQMGTFYNARALEWFECGRTDYLRMIGLPYVQMEARGVYLPIIEARLLHLGLHLRLGRRGRAGRPATGAAATLIGTAGRRVHVSHGPAFSLC